MLRSFHSLALRQLRTRPLRSVLTAFGDTFATRVAASLITAAGLPELAMATWEDYVETAIAFGRDRIRTRSLHEHYSDAVSRKRAAAN